MKWIEELAQDLRYAARMLIKSPGFAVVAILTLALGIGANTAVFSIINGALLRPLPYRQPERLVAIWNKSMHDSSLAKVFVSYGDFEEWSRHTGSFEQVAAETWAMKGGQILSGRGPARQVLVIPVSSAFFNLLGVQPAMGRTFTAEDSKRGCTVMLSDHFWRSALSADPKLLGGTVAIDQQACTVVGVMPPDFEFYPNQTQMWRLITPEMTKPLDKYVVGIFARLKPGVTREQAQAEVAALHAAAHRDDSWKDFTPIVYDLQDQFVWLAGRNLRITLYVLLAAVGFVLLITCLNVANLLLGRALGREHEMAIRAALGSGRSRLVRQLLTEELLLAFLGGAAGVLMAYGAIRYFNALNPIELPSNASVEISLPVLAVTGLLALATAFLFGLAPALKSSRLDINEGLRAGGRGTSSGRSRHRTAKAVLAAEVALSVVLLTGAGLLMESVLHMGSEPLGFDPQNVLNARLTLPVIQYSDPARRIHFFEELLGKAVALPGVEAVALSSQLPNNRGGNQGLEVLGKPADHPRNIPESTVSRDYFRVLQIQLHRGRTFSEHDRENSEPVAVINEALRTQFFSDRDPIGQKVRFGGEKNPWLTIVGVVANEKEANVFQEMNWREGAVLFRPLSQDPQPSQFLSIRTSGHSSPALAQELQQTLTAMDADVPLGDLEPMSKQVSKVLSYPRFRAVLLAAFAAFALLLAAVGLHGVLQQLVAQRTQEIGIRMAIGARPVDILRLIATEGGIPVLGGLVVGIASALALGQYLASLLYGVRPGDPLTLAGVSIALAFVATLAVMTPARRAARVDPMIALRHE